MSKLRLSLGEDHRHTASSQASPDASHTSPLLPVTDHYRTEENETIRLYTSISHGLVACVRRPSGKPIFIGAANIHSGLDPTLSGDALQRKLASGPATYWQLGYDAGKRAVTVWPDLRASGQTDRSYRAPDFLNAFTEAKSTGEAEAILQAKGFRECGRYGDASSWQDARGRLAQVFPGNDALPPYVRSVAAHRNVDVASNDAAFPRPSGYRVGVRDEVYEKGREWTQKVYDSATSQAVAKKSGWDMAHQPFCENSKSASYFAAPSDHRDTHNDATRYEPQLAGTNRSHAFEGPGPGFLHPVNVAVDVNGEKMYHSYFPLDANNPKWQLARAFGEYLYSRTTAKSFYEYLQMTGLVGTYNRLNPGHPLPNSGKAFAPIGGVGLKVGSLPDLKNTLSHLTDTQHVFLFDTPDNLPPCSNEQMQQITREMAIGIFQHGKRPMFTLHFTEGYEVFSALPPEYENTLVGQTMAMLDYTLKGYLAGGAFRESFVAEWSKRSNPDTQGDGAFLVDMHSESERISDGDHRTYRSVREALRVAGLADSPLLQDFRASCCIMADNPIVRVDQGFLVGCDFKVTYDIEGSPKLNAYVDEYRAAHGRDPEEYTNIHKVFGYVTELLKRDFPRLSFTRDQINMLGWIHFLSHYFESLKEMQKVPLLEPVVVQRIAPVPRRFPPLPIRDRLSSTQPVSLSSLHALFTDSEKRALDQLLREVQQSQGRRPKIPAVIKDALGRAYAQHLAGTSSIPIVHVPVDEALCNQLSEQLLQSAFETIVRLDATYAITLREKEEELARLEHDLKKAQALFATHEAETVARANQGIESQWNSFLTTLGQYELELRHAGHSSQTVADNARTYLATLRQEHAKEKQKWQSWQINDMAPWHASLATELKRIADARANVISVRDATLLARDAAPVHLRKLFGRFACKPMATTAYVSSTYRHQEARIGGVVGGCIMALTDATIPQEKHEGALKKAKALLRSADPEVFQEVSDENRKYFAFRLPLADTAIADDADYILHTSLVFDEEATTMTPSAQGLVSCIASGDVRGLQDSLVAAGGDAAILLAMHDDAGMSCMHYAAAKGDIAMAQLLQQFGGQWDLVSLHGLNSMHVAAIFGHSHFIERFGTKATLRATTSVGADALYLAAQHDQLEAIRTIRGMGVKSGAATTNSMRPLHTAVLQGFHEVVKELLSWDKEAINTILPDGCTALHLGAILGDATMVVLLSRAGAKQDIRRHDGMTAQHLAASEGKLEALQALVGQKGVDVSAVDFSGATPLHFAAKFGHLDVANVLMAAGAKVDAQQRSGETPLMAAIASAQSRVAEAIVQVGPNFAIKNAEGQTALTLAARAGLFALVDDMVNAGAMSEDGPLRQQADLARQLCRHGQHLRVEAWLDDGFLTEAVLTAPDARGDAPIWLGVENGHEDIVVLARSRVLTVEAPENSPLQLRHFAALHGWRDMLAEEVDAQSDIEDICKDNKSPHFGKSLAYLAAEGGSAECLEYLLGLGAASRYDYAGRSWHVLEASIASCQKDCVDVLLLSYGANTLLGAQQVTPLQLAVRQQDEAIIDLLHSRGGDFLLPGADGSCALHDLVRYASIRLIEKYLTREFCPQTPAGFLRYVVHHGLPAAMEPALALVDNVDESDEASGYTALAACVISGRVEHMDELLSAGADPGRVYNDGHNALTLAAASNNELFLMLLVHLVGDRAELFSSRAQGKTALHWACEGGSVANVRLLLQCGCDPNALTHDGRTAQEMAASYPEVLLALGSDVAGLDALKEGINTALRERDIKSLQDIHKRLPLSTPLDLRGEAEQFGNAFVPPVHTAVYLGFADVIDIVERDALRCVDSLGHNLAHVGAAFGNERVLRAANEAGIDLNATSSGGNTPLHRAAMAGHHAVAAYLLGRGVSVNAIDVLGQTPLMLAAKVGTHEVAQILLEHGADPYVMSKTGEDSLMIALKENNFLLTRMLLEKVDVNRAAGPDRKRYLHLAIASKDHTLMMLALGAGAKVAASDGAGIYPIHAAALMGTPSMLQALLDIAPEELERRSKSGLHALHFTAQNEDANLCKMLLEQGADANVADTPDETGSTENFTPLMQAASEGKIEIVRLLIDHGGDVETKDWQGKGLIEFAAEAADPVVFDFLIKTYPQLSVDEEGKGRALQAAIVSGRSQAVKSLIACGLDVNTVLPSGCTPLTAAPSGGDAHLSAYLLRRGADPNIKDASGTSPLQAAVYAHNIADIRILLSAGAEATLRDKDGDTLLHLAVQEGHLASLGALLRYGADSACVNNAGLTPAQLAASTNKRDLLECLLAFGAHLNPVRELPRIVEAAEKYQGILRNFEDSGDATLHRVARLGLRQLVALAASGSDVDAPNARGETPLQLATRHGITEALLAHGANPNLPAEGDNAPLMLAVNRASVADVEILCAYGAETTRKDARGHTPAERAYLADSMPVFRALCLATPFSDAAFGALKKAMEQDAEERALAAFLAAGAKPRTIEKRLELAVAALSSGHSAFIDKWVELGSALQDDAGRTLLHHMAASARPDDVTALVEQNAATLTNPDNNGWTPYLEALKHGNTELAVYFEKVSPLCRADATELTGASFACWNDPAVKKSLARLDTREAPRPRAAAKPDTQAAVSQMSAPNAQATAKKSWWWWA